MIELLVFLPFLIPVVAANFSERHRHQPYVIPQPGTRDLRDVVLRYLPHGLVAILNLGWLGVTGLALLNGLAQLAAPELIPPEAAGVNWLGVAVACFLTSSLAYLPLIPAMRRWLVRWLPLDPGSHVHMVAVVLAIYQIGLGLGQMILIGSLENLTDAELALGIWDVVLSAIPLSIFALAGVGLLIRRGGKDTIERLGLRRPTWRQLLVAGVLTAALLGFDFLVSVGWQGLNPSGYELMERVTENIFGDLITVGGALALGFSAGIGEELLFRGAVQPRLGIVLTTVLFAIGHLQYGLTLATLEVFIIGLVLALVRKRAHTTMAMIIHIAYNAVGTLMGLG
jgi:membrane protease YdiL (CAAX protease family)